MRGSQCTAPGWHGFWAALALSVVVGCLPAGDPPRGRHLTADRTLSAVQFSPTEQDGVPSYLLVSGPVYIEAMPDAGANAGQPVAATDLYQVQDATPPAAPRRLVQGRPVMAGIAGTPAPQNDFVLADSLGRLVLQHRDPNFPANPLAFRISRLDLANSQMTPLTSFDRADRTRQPQLRLSPGRTRVVVDSGNLEIFELENQRSWVELGGAWGFWGEDLYYSGRNTRGDLVVSRLKPHAGSEILARQAQLVTVFAHQKEPAAAPEPRLLVKGVPNAYFVLDPASLQQSPLPTAIWDISVSPSGRWMRGTIRDLDSNQDVVVVLDWAAGEVHKTVAWPSGTVATVDWRPGHDELWLGGRDGRLAIWAPPDQVRVMQTRNDGFSADGRFWFSEEAREPDRFQLYAGVADAPEGARYPLNPPGTYGTINLTAAGDWVVADLWLDDAGSRFDYAVVNPATGQSCRLAVKGRLIALSATRALAYADWDEGRQLGALALFDLGTGAKTVLAEEAYAAAVDPGFHLASPAPDGLAPGTRVAFLVRHRFNSPYDGLWVTELP